MQDTEDPTLAAAEEGAPETASGESVPIPEAPAEASDVPVESATDAGDGAATKPPAPPELGPGSVGYYLDPQRGCRVAICLGVEEDGRARFAMLPQYAHVRDLGPVKVVEGVLRADRTPEGLPVAGPSGETPAAG